MKHFMKIFILATCCIFVQNVAYGEKIEPGEVVKVSFCSLWGIDMDYVKKEVANACFAKNYTEYKLIDENIYHPSAFKVCIETIYKCH